jgi:hypothetical protein
MVPNQIPKTMTMGGNQRPAQIALKNFFEPPEVLHIKGIIQAECFDQFRDILGLLGGGYKGGRSALGTEGHEDAEDQNRNAEKNKNQQEKPSGNESVHGRQIDNLELGQFLLQTTYD